MSGSAWTGDGTSVDPIEAKHFADQDWSNGEVPPPMPKEAIIMGDFNSVSESDEYVRMVGEIDLSYGRVTHLDSFVDSWTVANDGCDDPITWWPDPPERSPGHGVRLDYCFVSPDLAHKIKGAWVDSASIGSDHRPYWVELDL